MLTTRVHTHRPMSADRNMHDGGDMGYDVGPGLLRDTGLDDFPDGKPLVCLEAIEPLAFEPRLVRGSSCWTCTGRRSTMRNRLPATRGFLALFAASFSCSLALETLCHDRWLTAHELSHLSESYFPSL